MKSDKIEDIIEEKFERLVERLAEQSIVDAINSFSQAIKVSSLDTIYPNGIESNESFGVPTKTGGGISPDYVAAEELRKAELRSLE